MPTHVFVDENKERGYFVAAAALLTSDVTDSRKAMRGLIMPGQKRLHFHKERDSRRRAILQVIVDLHPEVHLYDATRQPRRQQREACLAALVNDLMRSETQILVLDQDDSVLVLDNQLLHDRLRRASENERFMFRHQRGAHEPLLAIPDAVAWCWHRGGDWHRRIRPVVTGVTKI